MNEQLPAKQIILMIVFAVLFGGPAFFMVEKQIGLGQWVISFQDNLFGTHLLASSMAIVILIEVLCIGVPLWFLAFLVRAITGRTLVDLMKRK